MLNELLTAQGQDFDENAWNIYPRPQMRRESYVNLNGLWDFAVSKEKKLPKTYEQKIRVPFCPESTLSGIKMDVEPGSYLFYRRQVSLPESERVGRVLLHIGAADQVAEVFVNGRPMDIHEGGYTSFTVDITAAIKDENELVIRVFDDLRDLSMPYGKQSLNRGGMWYTPVSGIWQSVWLECVPVTYIESLQVEACTDYGVMVRIRPEQDAMVIVEGLGEFPMKHGRVVIRPENPHLWSPEDPYLYNFMVVTETDRVDSYFALRWIEAKKVNGIPRLLLNGKPYFFHGLLDQGYWPDGIYTPASPECYKEDILAMKKLGFNTLRKHIKIEPEEFYYQCDKLGMVVFQDMVNNGDYDYTRDTVMPTLGFQKCNDNRLHKDEKGRQRFMQKMEETHWQLGSHPCILYWTIFNEGWGQFEADKAYDFLCALDVGRIIDSTSGWFRNKETDVESMHIYFGPWSKLRKTKKPLVLSEFGGYACPVKGHLFNPDKAYGYKSCKSLEDFQISVDKLYRKRILPKVKKGLCAAIITQVSDVEDEINGFLTYDRKVCKADEHAMQKLAQELQEAIDA